MWVRHHLRPGEFYNLPEGERLFLLASTQIEAETGKSPRPSPKGGVKRAK